MNLGLWLRGLVPLALLSPLGAGIAAGELVAIRFEGAIAEIDDAGGWAQVFGLEAGSPVDAVYALDPESGTISFGDGRHGARLPEGGGVASGRYRAGVGSGGNLTLFDDCFVAPFRCVTGNGGDAYVVELNGTSDSGVLFTLLLELSDSSPSIFDENDLPLLPPEVTLFESRRFDWVLTGSGRTTRLSGDLVDLRVVPESEALSLLISGGLYLLVTRRPGRRSTTRS